jgi:hypothetical protein
VPQFDVQAPDGRTITIEGPPGSTQAQAIAQAQAQYKPGSHPADGAIAGEPDLGGIGNAALAGGIGFVHNLPFVGDAVLSGARAVVNARNGQPFNWQQDNDEAHQIINSAAAQHPVTSTVGSIGGAVDSAVVGGGLVRGAAAATEGVPVIGRGLAAIANATALRKGQLIGNAGRMALAGAAGGAAQGAGEQLARDPTDIGAAAQGGGYGAAGGAVAGLTGGAAGSMAGAVGGAVARRVVPGMLSALDSKTAATLAKAYGDMSPQDLQALWASHVQETGVPPSMAEMSNYRQAGIVQGFAKQSGTIADALNARELQASAARSTRMQSGLAPSPPSAPLSGQVALPPQGGGGYSPEEIANVNTAQGDVDYRAARAHNFTIPTAESEALGGISPADHMASQVVPLAGLKTVDRVRIVNGLQNGQLSGQDAQLISKGLGAAQGRGSNYSPAIASAQGDLADLLHGPGNDAASGALDQANANYAATAQRQAGAEHGGTILGAQSPQDYAATAASKPNDNPNFAPGMQGGARVKMAQAAGTPQGAISLAQRIAEDSNLHAKLTTTFGPDVAASWQRVGAAEFGAADALHSSQVGAPAAEPTGLQMKDLAQVGAALASHGVTWKAYQAANALAGSKVKMSPEVQAKVAEYLTKPDMAPAAFNLMRKAGVETSAMRQMVISAAAASGILSGDAVNGSMENSQ